MKNGRLARRFFVEDCNRLLMGVLLWKRAEGGLRNLGGLLVTVAVAMMPLAIYGLQRWSG